MSPRDDEHFEIDATAVMLRLVPSKRRLELGGSASSSSSCVAFSAKHELFEYESDFESSPRELWISREDVQEFRKECHHTIRVAMSGRLSQYPDLCDRGLEGMTKAGSLQVKNRRKYAREVLMSEQNRQRTRKSFNLDVLSESYQRATARSQMLAAAQGRADEVAARW